MISKKIRKKLKKRSFELNIFETTVFFITDEAILQSVYDDIEHDETAKGTHGQCLSTVENGKKDIFIGLFINRDDVLVHECVHASLYILNNIQEVADERSELQPYLIQTLFRECKRLLSK